MNILILHKAMVIGGVEKNLLTYNRIFNELGYNVEVFLVYDLSFNNENLQNELSCRNNKIHYAISKNVSNKILENQLNKKKFFTSKIYYELSRCYIKIKKKRKIKHLLSKSYFDIVIDFSGVLDDINYKDFIKIPTLRWFQSETDVERFKKYPNRFEYAKIISITQAMRDKLFSLQPKNKGRFELIYNPIDHTECIQRSLESTNIENEDYMLAVARLVEGKGLVELIEIYSGLVNEGVKEKLYIVGDGELRQVLENKIKQLSLENKCILLGNKLNPYPYFKSAKIFLFTSESEGFGIVILESMVFSVPTIVMDCPTGPREILGLNSQYGKLIPLHDKLQFSNAVKELLNNNEIYQQYKHKSYERSLDFSIEKIKQKIQELFISLDKIN